MRILVADDDVPTRVMLRRLLEKSGHEVIECGDGTEVMARLFTNELPQLVMLDWLMPGADGLALCKAIREQVNRPYTYVMMITGKSGREDVLAGLRHGVNDYITKPLKTHELEARLQVALQMIELNNLVESQKLRLIEASRLAVLGQMAAGVAHEINNPLAIIKAHVEKAKAAGPPEQAASHQAIGRAISRISTTVRALRDFAMEDDGAPFVDVRFVELMDSVLSLCREKLSSHGIDLHMEVPADISVLHVQKMRIGQVMLALIDNAAHALEQTKKPFIRIEGFSDKEFHYFAVCDNGSGVPASVRQTLLHPFVSTRGHLLSSGLGLSISRGIIAFHGGRLFLDEQSQLTRVVFSIPRARRKAA